MHPHESLPLIDWQRLQRIAIRVCLGALVLALLAWTGDWAMWRLHHAQGSSATASVAVTRMVVAPLKGNREEYYMDGTETVACSRSLFPQGGMEPCWWLERHRVIFVR